MNSNVDLQQLSVRRQVSPATPRQRPRHFWTRYFLPGVVLFGFIAVMGWAVRESFLPSQAVTVVPVLTSRLEVQSEGSPMFQTAGWVEPRPMPLLITALAEGVVDKMFVVEGQKVKAGDKLAQLIQADALLALEGAQADLELRLAEMDNTRASLKAARINLERPVQLQASLGEAEALVAQKETELAGLPFQITSARARLFLAKESYERKRQAPGAVAPLEVSQAKSELDTTTATVAELDSRQVSLKREVEAQKQRRDALRLRIELKTEETRAAAEAEANLKAAEARTKQARVALAAAKLRLERMTIHAPVDGQVLALVGRPGMRVSGNNARAEPASGGPGTAVSPGSLYDSSTLVSLYDPNMLQVRADVRFEDVPRVQPGQRARIETAAAPGGALDGEVLTVTSQADIQKNTLQVKVAIKAPPPALRPDMLVQVTFLSLPRPKAANPESQPLRLLIPHQLVEKSESGQRVWVADLAGKVARSKTVKLGPAGGDLVEVLEGLSPADKVISGGRQGLRDGQRITVTGED